MSLGVININIDPIALHIGSGGIHWYGIMYAIAFITAFQFAVLPQARRYGISREQVERVVIVTIVVGLISARLFFVLQQPDLGDYLRQPIRIIAVWEGGMAFFGAIIGGVAALGFMAWRKRLASFWVMFDGGVLFAVVGQPIGRIGNLINGDILGGPSNAWYATAYTFHAAADRCAVLQTQLGFQCGQGYQPAAAYEALGTIAIGLVLLWLWRRHVRAGIIGISYVALYAISQFLIFFARTSEPTIGLGLKQAQWTSIVMFFLVVPLLVVAWRRWGPKAAAEAPSSSPNAAT